MLEILWGSLMVTFATLERVSGLPFSGFKPYLSIFELGKPLVVILER